MRFFPALSPSERLLSGARHRTRSSYPGGSSVATGEAMGKEAPGKPQEETRRSRETGRYTALARARNESDVRFAGWLGQTSHPERVGSWIAVISLWSLWCLTAVRPWAKTGKPSSSEAAVMEPAEPLDLHAEQTQSPVILIAGTAILCCTPTGISCQRLCGVSQVARCSKDMQRARNGRLSLRAGAVCPSPTRTCATTELWYRLLSGSERTDQAASA